MRLGGGMLPPVYSANHGMSFLRKKFFIYGSKNPKHGKKANLKNQIKETTISWSNKNFKDVCKINRPARNGKDAYQIVKRYMNSLEEMGLPLYPEYTKKELEIYYPQDLTDASFFVKRSKHHFLRTYRILDYIIRKSFKMTTLCGHHFK